MLQLPYSMFLTFLALQLYHGATINDIIPSRPLFPNGTLISSNRTFELGFFRPNISSNNHYVGIWYKNTSPAKVVWVANRNTPLPYSDRSASLTIGKDGNLKLLDGQKNEIWTTASPSSSGSLSAILLDTGNFVLKDAGSGIGLWESFANPSDTLVQNMKTEINVFTRTKNYLTCWKSEVDPSDGSFVAGITSNTPRTPPEMFTWNINGSIPYWRSGQWDKAKFIGIETMIESYSSVFDVQQDIQQGTTYFVINNYNSSEFRYIYLRSNGSLHLMYTNNRTDGWIVEWEAPTNPCEVYGTCGRFGICNIRKSTICSCLEGFLPNSVEEWNRGDWSGGCKRATELNCEKNASMITKKQDVFMKIVRVKLPDSPVYLGMEADSLELCLTWCLNNCRCLAFAYVKTIGCMTWTNELMDVQQFSFRGEDLFLRLAYIDNSGNSRRKREIVISLAIISSTIVLGAALWALCKRRAKRKKSFTKIGKNRDLAVIADGSSDLPNGITSLKEQLKGEDGQMLSVFYFDSILVATDNFSSENKLGQGGFGSVYKGKLQDGKSVAVKRLSSNSGQGMEEFKTEILLISKLQHRNLVRLIGCCIEEEEKILIYEYLPNKSLDTFLFNPTNKKKLNWDTRFQIIQGIARGLLYLHRDSHLRVIHRDLKASNVLLDEKLNPKISDFGLARIFEGTQDVVNTQRVVGTLGYMAPEYAMGGIFSEKSDIYSFGVLVLEIVSSMKNTSFYYNEQHVNLLSYTWQLWKERRANDLLDQELLESSSLEEVEKCIQVGLMCVQNHARERPHISSVIQMLNGELNLSEPKEPAFSFQRNLTDHGGQEKSWSTVAVTISTTEGR